MPPNTYRSKILLVERGSLYRSLHKVSDFCLTRKPIERRGQRLLDMVVRIPRYLQPQCIKVREHGGVVIAIIVEGDLVLASAGYKTAYYFLPYLKLKRISMLAWW